MQMLNVADLRAAINGDGGGESFIEEFALVVSHDDHRLGIDLLEFAAQRFHGGAAAFVALAARF